MELRKLHRLIGLIGLCVFAAALPVAAELVELGYSGKGTALVADPAASQGKAVAVRVGEEKERAAPEWPLGTETLTPGLYRMTVKLRLSLPKDFDSARLLPILKLRTSRDVLVDLPLNWTVFDGRENTYTAITREFSVTRPGKALLTFDWHIAPLPVTQKKRPIQPRNAPKQTKIEFSKERGGEDALVKDFAKSLDDEHSKPIALFDDPAVLLDTVELTRLSNTLVIERVWPQKIHVYPGGEANPITVTVRNYQPQPMSATVRLCVQTGLTEATVPVEAKITVPGDGTAEHQFEWVSGQREFGHAASAELIVDGKTVHSASEYFSVSAPIWKTSLQGSGFITWYGREQQFPEHVASTRRHYMNVEEAFSWQPSSWTDLNPTTPDWWTGQGDAHNSLSGLRTWMELSHRNGIKMITYSWPTASGPAGFEWARKHPHLISHGAIGPGPENFDLDNFRLYDLAHSRPELKYLHEARWDNLWLNFDLLPTIDFGATEIIKSAKKFGWDGIRFDYPPLGGEKDAAEVHEEFADLGVAKLMEKLLPEYYGIKKGTWDGIAMTARNVRYLRHRFATEVGPNFAMSYNGGGGLRIGEKGEVAAWPNPATPKLAALFCEQGGQIMDEATGRHAGSWKWYRQQIPPQVELTRRSGGYHECVVATTAAHFGYQAIFTFAAGSHSYGEFNWGAPSPGQYPRFMTRYGEYCWDHDLEPIAAEAAGLRVNARAELLWQPYTRWRRLPNGTTQTVVHLITPPTNDQVAVGGSPPVWQRGITVHKRGSTPPTVWRLTAEPDVQCEKLDAWPEGDGFIVTIAEHRLWTMLVWEEGAK
jgi:hypothetical protein